MAVLQLEDASGLDTVSTDNDGVTQGDAVTAVGDGNGTVDYLSAATGQVIATDQSITTQSEGAAEGESLTGLIEISSDVVGGFSGGATYDADGQVVGMTTAASSGGDVVGYAIPISKVLSIADDLESGVTDTAYAYGYPAFLGVGLDTGTVVQGVYDGTPAADAGIAAGDTITTIDGTGRGELDPAARRGRGPLPRRRRPGHLDRQPTARATPRPSRSARARSPREPRTSYECGLEATIRMTSSRRLSACASPAGAAGGRSGCRRSRTPRAAGAR